MNCQGYGDQTRDKGRNIRSRSIPWDETWAEGILELSQAERLAQAQQFHPETQHVQRAPVIHLLADAVEQDGFRSGAVAFGQSFPSFGLGFPHPGQHIGREQRPLAVIRRRVGGITRARGAYWVTYSL